MDRRWRRHQARCLSFFPTNKFVKKMNVVRVGRAGSGWSLAAEPARSDNGCRPAAHRLRLPARVPQQRGVEMLPTFSVTVIALCGGFVGAASAPAGAHPRSVFLFAGTAG